MGKYYIKKIWEQNSNISNIIILKILYIRQTWFYWIFCIGKDIEIKKKEIFIINEIFCVCRPFVEVMAKVHYMPNLLLLFSCGES